MLYVFVTTKNDWTDVSLVKPLNTAFVVDELCSMFTILILFGIKYRKQLFPKPYL